MRSFVGLFATALTSAIIGLGGLLPAHAQLAPAPTRAYRLRLDEGVKTAVAVAGAATLNKSSGTVTSEALVTATGGVYTLTVTNNTVAAADLVFASVAAGTSTTGVPVVATSKANAGGFVVTVRNADAAPFNGTIKVSFMVLKN